MTPGCNRPARILRARRWTPEAVPKLLNTAEPIR
jgi:hypothetical protein